MSLRRLRLWDRGALEISDRTFWAVVCALILFGIALRSLGYFKPLEFWMDESLWAERFATGQGGLLRPPGYMWLSGQLIELRATEPVIRLLSYVAGLASLPLLVAMLRPAGLRRPLILFGLFVLAVHPVAVAFSKEFKPYELELSLHLGLLALAFCYARSSRWPPLVGLCGLAAIAPLFAWSVVVLYPGLFAAAAIVSRRDRARRKLAFTVSGAAVTAAVLVWMYVSIHSNRSADVEFWGERYDVFFVGDGVFEHLWWYVKKTGELLAASGHLAILWFPSIVPNPVLAALHIAMCLVGLVAVAAERRWLWALLWVSPWLVTIGLNAAGKWPYGEFRANLFFLAYSLPLALAGLQAGGRWLARRFARGALAVPVFCLIYAVVCSPVRLSYFAIKPPEVHTVTQSTRRAMEIIAEVERQSRSPFRERPGRDVLLLDSHAYANYSFYANIHAETRALGRFLDERFRPKKGGYSEKALLENIARESKWGFWLVVSKPSLSRGALQRALWVCHVDHVHKLPEDNLVLRCLSKNR